MLVKEIYERNLGFSPILHSYKLERVKVTAKNEKKKDFTISRILVLLGNLD
jgi:hypothetical protein